MVSGPQEGPRSIQDHTSQAQSLVNKYQGKGFKGKVWKLRTTMLGVFDKKALGTLVESELSKLNASMKQLGELPVGDNKREIFEERKVYGTYRRALNDLGSVIKQLESPGKTEQKVNNLELIKTLQWAAADKITDALGTHGAKYHFHKHVEDKTDELLSRLDREDKAIAEDQPSMSGIDRRNFVGNILSGIRSSHNLHYMNTSVASNHFREEVCRLISEHPNRSGEILLELNPKDRQAILASFESGAASVSHEAKQAIYENLTEQVLRNLDSLDNSLMLELSKSILEAKTAKPEVKEKFRSEVLSHAVGQTLKAQVRGQLAVLKNPKATESEVKEAIEAIKSTASESLKELSEPDRKAVLVRTLTSQLAAIAPPKNNPLANSLLSAEIGRMVLEPVTTENTERLNSAEDAKSPMRVINKKAFEQPGKCGGDLWRTTGRMKVYLPNNDGSSVDGTHASSKTMDPEFNGKDLEFSSHMRDTLNLFYQNLTGREDELVSAESIGATLGEAQTFGENFERLLDEKEPALTANQKTTMRRFFGLGAQELFTRPADWTIPKEARSGSGNLIVSEFSGANVRPLEPLEYKREISITVTDNGNIEYRVAQPITLRDYSKSERPAIGTCRMVTTFVFDKDMKCLRQTQNIKPAEVQMTASALVAKAAEQFASSGGQPDFDFWMENPEALELFTKWSEEQPAARSSEMFHLMRDVAQLDNVSGSVLKSRLETIQKRYILENSPEAANLSSGSIRRFNDMMSTSASPEAIRDFLKKAVEDVSSSIMDQWNQFVSEAGQE